MTVRNDMDEVVRSFEFALVPSQEQGQGLFTRRIHPIGSRTVTRHSMLRPVTDIRFTRHIIWPPVRPSAVF